MTGSSASVADSFARALDQFLTVPAPFARYDVGISAVAQILAVDQDQIAELAAHGLPHGRDADADADAGLLFDYNDVLNLAMYGSQSRQSIPELALRFLLRFAAGPPAGWYQPKQWLVQVRAPRPPAGTLAAAARQVVIQQPDFAAPGVDALDLDANPESAGPQIEAPGYQAAVRLTGAEGTVRSALARAGFQDLVDALSSGQIVYQAVAEPLRMRHESAWRLGMADCVVVARLLAERLRRGGLRARARRGYLLGLVGSDHAWCELYEDDQWKPLDVVFAYLSGAGATSRNLQPAPEFSAACCGSRFNRLLPCAGDEATALVHLGGRAAPAWALAGVSVRPWGP
jgi:Transglutaminase-like superfamily